MFYSPYTVYYIRYVFQEAIKTFNFQTVIKTKAKIKIYHKILSKQKTTVLISNNKTSHQVTFRNRGLKTNNVPKPRSFKKFFTCLNSQEATKRGNNVRTQK